jgi:hypothetical protein
MPECSYRASIFVDLPKKLNLSGIIMGPLNVGVFRSVFKIDVMSGNSFDNDIERMVNHGI